MPNFVEGHGPTDAKIVIVGEAPGEQENRHRQPFVGASGKLLTMLLGTAGIARPRVYVTNVIKEQPPGNNISHFIDLSKKVPKISDSAQMYIDYLHRELASIQPNVVIAMGNTALWALTGKKGITKWRGSVLKSHLGYKVIPTFHPAAALRGGFELRYVIGHDLAKAAEHKNRPEIAPDTNNYIISPTSEQAIAYIRRCQEADLVAYDIECMATYDEENGKRYEVSYISFAYRDDEAMAVPFFRGGKNFYTPPEEISIWRAIRDLMASNTPKVAHNANFDSTFIFQRYGIAANNLHCSMIGMGLCMPGLSAVSHPLIRGMKPKSLAFLTSWFTDMPYYKDDGKENFNSQDNRIFAEYNAKDSIVLIKAFPRILEWLERDGNMEIYETQRALLPILTFMTTHGMRIDTDFKRKMSMLRQQELNELEAEIQKAVGRPINPASTQQLLEYFYEEKGYKVYKNRQTGRPTTDEKALKRLAGTQGSPVAALILKYRGKLKEKGTYYDMKLDPDGRLRSSMNPIGTWTTRLSSSKTIFRTGGNIQTLPYMFKGVVLPDDGQVLYEMDLGQAENRIVAYIAPEPSMIQAFEDGADIHSRTAGRMFGIDELLIKQWDKLLAETKDKRYAADIGQGDKSHRFWGKQANHALNYGLHFVSAALRWEISQADAKRIYELYHNIYPGVQRMHSWIRNKLREDRTLTNLFGHNLRFIGDWETIQKQAFAFIPQSSVAQIINRQGLIRAYQDQELFHCLTLLNQVHDSLVFQIPLSAGFEAHAKTIGFLTDSLEQPLTFRGRTWSIPAELTMYGSHMTGGAELYRPTAEELERKYLELTNS